MKLKTNKRVALKYPYGCDMEFPFNLFSDLIVFVSLFAAFYIFVALLKSAFFWLRHKYGKLFRKKRPVPVRHKKPRRPAAIRSIEINPDEVDRIYVKKIS